MRIYMCRGVAIGKGVRGARRTMAPPTSISKPNMVQEVWFQTSGIVLFEGVQKLYIPTRNFTTFPACCNFWSAHSRFLKVG